ncbi:MAG: dimethyl sulfoxide reductase anchor subunit [Eggerthellaceae bacterium]|nr:dimethyl sulfoxide reductase anchor subunit [Eggerthellaceae bacterium]
MAIQWPILIFGVLAGIAAGIMVFLGIGELKGRFRSVRVALAIIALILLVVGGLVSVFHLGHPERALYILGNPASGLSHELFAVGAMFVIALAYVIIAKKGFDKAAKVLSIIAAVAGLVLPFIAGASYKIAARPAWDSITLPLMFVGTGIGCGMLLSAAFVLMRDDAEDRKLAGLLAICGAAVMAITVIAYIIWVAVAPFQNETRSIARVISGDQAALFWLGVAVIGILVPIACAFVGKKASSKGRGGATVLWAALCAAVIGSVAIRVIMFALGTSVEQFIYL